MVRLGSAVFVLLLLFVRQGVSVVRAKSGDNLVRKRREWVPPPKLLTENVDYTNVVFVAKIHSDYDDGTGNIYYSLEGIGANQYPFHVFRIDPRTGLIRVNQILDREEIDTYSLSGVATFNNGTEAERKIDIRFKVVDQNDNGPVFGPLSVGVVDELSPTGTSVLKVIATDADEPNHENSQIAYTIINQNPSNKMFYISNDGTISVNKPSLDREKVAQYSLTVKAQDLKGKSGGNSATATVTINIRDVNDNPPTLEKDMYEGSIEENTQGVEVMRLKAQDLDLENTENWEAVFDIVKGNEAGYFSIRTDPNTNEGILMLNKAVDYEDVKELDLGIVVQNKAPPHDGSGVNAGAGISFGGGAFGAGGASGASSASGASNASGASGGSSWQSRPTSKTYPVKINVKNQREGAHFDPKVKAIPIPEGGNSINIKDVIARYPALDGDTGKPAQNVMYAKGSDPDNWLSIDPKTAEIKLNKIPDSESTFLVNGTYFTTILCISEDVPAKTATGTIAIQVEDLNDHCPTLTSNIQTMCTTDDAVIVNAKDEDQIPNGPPFDFAIVPEGTQGKWQVEHLNDTAAILRAQESMWPGFYEVEFMVKDQQGQACPEPQKVQVQVCTCEAGVVCGKRGSAAQTSKKVELGSAGIGLLLLGLLLLLLIPLLLLSCHCGSGGGLAGDFAEIPFDTKSHLINYHTEGQGENTEVPLLNTPMQMDGNCFKVIPSNNDNPARVKSDTSVGGINRASDRSGYVGGEMEKMWEGRNQNVSGFYQAAKLESRGTRGGGGGIFDDMALPHDFFTQYYTQKVTGENNSSAVKDSLLVYDYEGHGSTAGSVGCCSLLESENDLQFLDNLGPKFKTLAQVCGGKTISTEVKSTSNPLPSAFINTQTSVSRSMTVPQLPPPPKTEPTISKTAQTVVREVSDHSQMMKGNTTTVKEGMTTVKGGMTTVKDGMANQAQMVLLQQQPVYYTTTPVLQPMHYVVQPQVQNTVLLTEPTTNLQGMVLVNSSQPVPAQGVVVQRQTVMSSRQAQGPGKVLMERSGGAGLHYHNGNLSGSQTMMVLDGELPAGSLKVLKGSQTGLIKGGTLQSGELSGSQSVLVVGGPTSSTGQLVPGERNLSQKNDVTSAQSVLYNTSTTTSVSTVPTYRKVVVKETREIH
ncbi:desmoglein-2-like [Mastacembelus armatus]|uniref:Desmoglein-2-like n=1 Tax=Mastacembelus armatus TaxID=205130 RepID=A0A3Q3LL91_9TELE|nr:desmoglein-2-like [Mastacembelus armatus]